jgi:adenylate kinase
MKFRTGLLFGAPGSGKGTQGRILGAIPDFFHFASGDAFRNLRPDDPLGRLFAECSIRGQLVPDEPTIQLCLREIEAAAGGDRFNPEKDLLVLDGVPRNVNQARLLTERLDVQIVLHLACPDRDRIIERMRRRALVENRPDDAQVEVIRRRLETYDRDTRPVLEFYGPSRVHEIDALQRPVAVLRQILDELIKL